MLYPYVTRGLRNGLILDSQKEALLKAMSGASGVSVRALTNAYKTVAKADPDKTPQPGRVGKYFVENGAICFERDTKDGPMAAPLCNFSARITEERERDDGVEKTLNLVLTGKMATGQPLPEAEVSASQFASLGWVVSEWGSRAVVYAGQGAKDHLRAALQILSGNVPRRTTYTHLGWREIGGRMVYLHAGGVLGVPVAPNAPITTQVEPPGGLETFVLPDPPTGDELKQAVRASLETLDLAPDPVSVPLFGMTYRAVFGGVDFGGHLAGQTGAGKSELAAMYQQHFGAGLDSRHLPGSWSSTANALEGLAFAGKDVLITVDDFAPEGSSYDIQRYHATAARLFRAQGNNAARGRMRPDGTLRPNKPPRGMILSTDEDIPKGHSIKARTLILELEPGALNWPLLTQAQAQASAGIYAAAMSGFIAWLAKDYKSRMAAFRADHERYRTELQSTGHKRTVDAGAQLLATYRTLLTFALEVEALTEPEHLALWRRIEAGIQAALEPQAALQAQSDPVARFSELLGGLLVSGRAHVADAETSRYPGEGWGWGEYPTSLGREFRPEGARIGWVDDSGLYLEPSVTYAALQSFARDQGDSVPVTERTLWKRLAEREIVTPAEDGHTTIKRTFTGAGRVRVLYIPTSTLSKIGAIGAIGADGAEPVRDGANPRPESGQQQNANGAIGAAEYRQAQRGDSAPKINGAAKINGAREIPSGTAHAPSAPIAPKNTGVGVATDKRENETTDNAVIWEEL